MGELRTNIMSPCSFLRGNTIRADEQMSDTSDTGVQVSDTSDTRDTDVQMSDTLPPPEKPSSGTEKIVGGGRTRQEGVSVAC